MCCFQYDQAITGSVASASGFFMDTLLLLICISCCYNHNVLLLLMNIPAPPYVDPT